MKIAIFAFSAAALLGCAAERTATTTTTAADVPTPSPREAAEPPAAAAADLPAGTLVCRAKSSLEGTIELYVDGSGAEASASLRTVAPSGAVTVQPLRAHRHKGLIFADEPSQTDLVSHAATVAPHDGKSMIRLGDPGQPWARCE